MSAPILFVDDEPDLRFMVSNFFEFAGYQLIAAADADEALRMSDGVTLGAIVLDVNLPGAGSAGLIKILKQRHPGVPVILYTGHQIEDDAVQNLLANGAQRYLLKDGSLAGLLGVVKEVCA